MKRPAFQFYPADWLNDTGLRACSLAARGLWIDALCFMHQGTPYGYLTFAGSGDGGRDIPTDVLARMVGSDVQEINQLLAELEVVGVFSRTPEGVIFSRRMVNDESKRQECAAHGVKSLLNPNVPKPKGKKGISGGTPTGISLDPIPKGSSSSSSSSSKQKPESVSSSRKKKTVMPENFGISDRVRQWATANGHTRLEKHLEHFVGYARANGKSYADWDQAFMNAIRGDWAKLKANGTSGIKQVSASAKTTPLLVEVAI